LASNPQEDFSSIISNEIWHKRLTRLINSVTYPYQNYQTGGR